MVVCFCFKTILDFKLLEIIFARLLFQTLVVDLVVAVVAEEVMAVEDAVLLCNIFMSFVALSLYTN